MRPKAVIFDFDGVICDTVEYHYLSWMRLAEEFGLPFSRQVNEKLRGLTRRKSLEVILDGRHLPEEQVKEMLALKNQYYLDLVNHMTTKDLLPGVAHLMQELKQVGLRVGVASASRNAAYILEQLGMCAWIDAVVDGNQVRRSKPAPDVYLKAAEVLQVPPETCLALEDSEAGIQAAREANMFVIGLGPAQRLRQAHAVFKDLESVRYEQLEAAFQAWSN